jgi:Domain of unknown function (DUF4149)
LILRNLFRVAFVLFAGSLWSLALWVAPTLFFEQPDRHLAGFLAARLFSLEAYLGLGVAALALLTPARSRLRGLYGAAALLALNEFVLRRLMERAQSHGTALGLGFGAWHGLSAVLYALAALGVLLIVWNENLR